MKHMHLTLEEREKIQEGLEQGLTKVKLAKILGKSQSTIGKEIKKHRKLKVRNSVAYPIDCVHFNKNECKKCTGKCKDYEKKSCIRRDRTIGVCNLCPDSSRCHLDKYFYYATQAEKQYLYTLRDSREGFNLTTSQAEFIAKVFKPLLKQGQSVYQILRNHPEVNISAKSFYTYIESNVFKDFGLNQFYLRKQVSMKTRKKLHTRKEPVNFQNHKYLDYLEFIKVNPKQITTEMDTVYNTQDGPYIQTFIFENTDFMIGFLKDEKTSEAMAATLDELQNILEYDYYKLFGLILTDRGSEFEKYQLFEINSETGEFRTNIFYCDPQSPYQKPHVENNHNFVRDIIPNGKSLKKLTQEDINLMFSHINSTPRASLNGKTPYEAFTFFYGKDIAEKLNIQKIEKDMVTLQPYLLKIK